MRGVKGGELRGMSAKGIEMSSQNWGGLEFE